MDCFTMGQVGEKIKRCQNGLQWWNKHPFCNISRSLTEKKSSLKNAKKVAQIGGNYELVFAIKKEIFELLLLEEQIWHQQSHVHRLKSSDKNSKFFHSKASQRLYRKRIFGIKNNNGVLCTCEVEFSGLLVSYYQRLFTPLNQ